MRNVLLLASPLLLLGACAAPTSEDAAADATEQEVTRAAGIELQGAGNDSALKVSLAMQKDTKDDVWDTYLKRAYVSRRGSKGFDCYCGIGAKVGSRNDEITISCTKYTKAVDDGQSLDFDVVLLNGQYMLRNVVLHGADLRGERDVLTAGGQGDRPLGLVRASTDPTKNPFAGPERINAALRPLLGTQAYSEAAGRSKPITGFDYSFSEHFDAGGTVFLDFKDRGGFGLSLATEQYHAAKGLVSASTLAKRARDGMPKAPQCDDGPTPGSVSKPVQSIENAISPLGGASFGLADEVKLANVPAAIAAKLKKAGDDIEKRSFPGSDYSASVFGYYAIHASCGDKTVVAYVVWGGGSGEPDYHDGVVVGFDLQGTKIHEAEDDG